MRFDFDLVAKAVESQSTARRRIVLDLRSTLIQTIHTTKAQVLRYFAPKFIEEIGVFEVNLTASHLGNQSYTEPIELESPIAEELSSDQIQIEFFGTGSIT